MGKAKSRLVLFFLLSLLAFLLSEKINFATADLGRHLQNGVIFFQTRAIPQTNLYSYTFPDFPFLNHHWLTGVVFFLIQKISGFAGLSLFSLILSLITFFLFFDIARKSSFPLAFLVSLIVIPVIASRREIRPEVFSYFFSGIFFWILTGFRQKQISPRWLLILPLGEIFWVNLHLYFFVGPLLILVFLAEAALRRLWGQAKILFMPFSLTLTATLLNPAFIDGAIYPLRVYDNYGYRVFEEQSFWFIEKVVGYPPAIYFKIALALLFGSWILLFWRRRPLILVNLFLTLVFSGAGMIMIRHFPFFGYFALPLITANLQRIIKDPARDEFLNKNYWKAGAVILFILYNLLPSFWSSQGRGWGLAKGASAAGDFFLNYSLAGPIFNNYDVGGYLIYYLYPQEKVFVDNRPAAYPADFFRKTYLPLQENESFWREKSQQYSFNVVFFYWRDVTPWGQKFLINRLKDPDWAPVYVDDKIIIFLKRTKENLPIIERFEIPKSRFILSGGFAQS